ncbi:MAG: butyrate kinase [Actinomycetota bacterium]
MNKIFAINPGSTSTKIGLFEGCKLQSEETIRYQREEIKKYPRVVDQLDFRLASIDRFLQDSRIDLSEIDFFIGRGGYLRPLDSGLYEVSPKMIDDLESARYGEHASNLGAVIAHYYASRHGKKAYIMDPICVDELVDIARVSGHPYFKRTSIFHALNQKKVARKAAGELGKKYEDANLLVVHMGGGITIGLHRRGRVVDVNNGTQGEGPFTPERSGGMELGSFLKYVFENRLDFEQSFRMVLGEGGLVAYFGTTDFSRLMDAYRKDTDRKVKLVIEAMAYQIAKEAAAMSVLAYGKVDAVILTGGLAYDQTFLDLIIPKVEFISPRIFVYPGENELEAMAEGIMLGLVEKKVKLLKY